MSGKNTKKSGEAKVGLYDNDDKYRTLVEQSLWGLGIIQDFRIVFANEALAQISGYSVDELLNLSRDGVMTLVHPEDQDLVWGRFQARIKGDEIPSKYEFRGLSKDGSLLWLEMYASIIDYQGKPAIQSTVIDITDRKLAEKKARESEEKYHNLFNKSNDAIFIHDLEGNTIDVNSRALDTLGYSFDEMIKLKILDLHPPEDLEKCDKAFETIAREGHVSFEIDFMKKNGDVFPAEVSSSLFEIGGKKVVQGIVRDITERRKAEEVIREGENKWLSLIENTSDFILIVDKKGIIQFINRTLPDLEMEDVIGKKIYDFQPPESQKIHKKILKKIFKTGESETFEAASSGLDGSLAWYETKAVPIKKGDQTTSVMLLGSDITEKNRAQMALSESEEKFRMFFENDPDYCYMISPKGTILDVNQSALKALGYEKEELLGRPLGSLYAPESIQRMEELFIRWKERGRIKNEEMIIQTKNGKKITVLLSADVVRGNDNEFLYSVSVQRDITGRKAMEEVLKRSEAKYRSLIEKAGAGIAITDDKGKLTFVNEALCKMIGYSEEELVGVQFIDFIHGDDVEEIIAIFDGAVDDSHKEVGLDFRINHKLGHVVHMHTRPTVILYDDKIVGFNAIITDITERKRAERAIAKRNEELSALNMIAGATNQSLEMNKVLNFALEETMSVLGAEGGIIALSDPNNQTLVPAFWEGFSEDIIKSEAGIKLGDGILGQTAQLGIPLLVPDLSRDKSDITSLFIDEGWLSLVCVPLKSKDKIVGVMTVSSRQRERFRSEEMEVIGAIGNQIGMAIQNAHLYEKSQNEITERMRVEEALRYRLDFENVITSISTDFISSTTQDMDADIDGALKRIGAFTDVDRSYIILLNENGSRMTNTHEWCSEGIESQKQYLHDVETGIFRWAIAKLKTEQLLNIPDMNALPPEAASDRLGFEEGGIQSVLSVPIQIGEDFFGFIGFDSVNGQREWTDDEISMLRMVAQIFANALERRKTEETLRENEEKYRNIIEQSSEGLILLNEEGNIMEWNKAQETITGIMRDEVIGQTFWDILYRMWPPEEKAQDRRGHVKKKMKEALTSQEASWMNAMNERRIQHVDGSERIVESTVFPIVSSKGMRFASINRDVTQRIKAEETIREEEEKFRLIMENTSDFITITDAAGNFVYVSPSQRNLGYEPEDLLGTFGEHLIHPDDIPGLLEGLRDIYELEDGGSNAKKTPIEDGTKPPKLIEYRIIDKQGIYHDIESTVNPVLDNQGNIDKVVHVSRDVSERKLAEKALRSSQAELSKIFNNIPILIMLVDKERRIRRINRVGSDFTAESDEEILGLRDGEALRCIHAGDDPKGCGFGPVCEDCVVRSTVLDTFEFNEPHHQKDANLTLRQGGHRKEINLLVSTTPVVVKGENMVLVCLEDITQRKQIENALRESEERFRDLVHLLPEGVFEIDLDGDFIFANQRAFEISGYSQGDIEKGVSAFQMFIPEDQVRLKENIIQILEGMDLGVNEYTAVRKDGSKYPVLIHSAAILQDGEPVGIRGIIIDVTEKKLAEKALKESEERFRSIVQSSPMGMHMYQLEQDGSLVFSGANPAADAIMGTENKQFIGKTIEEVFPSSRGTEIPTKYRMAAENGESWHTEQVTYEDDKVSGAFEVHAFQTSPGKMTAMFLDVTDRMKAQEAIRESEERYRTLFEKSPTSITMADKTGVIVDCNRLTEEITGYSREELIGRRYDELSIINPQNYPLLYGKLDGKSTDGEENATELVITTKNGDKKWIMMLNSPLMKDGCITGYQTIASEITERKKMEEALRESTNQWQTTFDTIKESICILNENGRILQSNVATIHHAHKPLKFILNHNCCGVMHGVSKPIEHCPFVRAKESKVRETLVLSIGDKWFNISVDPILDGHGNFTGAVHLMEDITESKKAEEELKQSLEEREILFRELKHRVKNNLQLLSSMVGMQIIRVDNDIALKKFEEIQSVIDTIALIYSRAYEDTGIKGLNLNNFIEELVSGLLRFKEEEDVRIDYSIEGDGIQLSTDQAIPMALIANEIVFNALKHAFVGKREGHISVVLNDDDGTITMTISDNGIGMPPELDVDKTDTLGLKLIKNLTKQLNGNLEIHLDKGSEFVINVPSEEVD